MMPAPSGSDIVVVSDLHMSVGYDARSGTFHRNEDFFYDDALGRFLDHLITQGHDESRTWRLVILGDVVDFLQVVLTDEPGAGATSSEASVERLRRIATGHPRFFAALARFLRAGHHIDVVFGNHDIEMVWPGVQAEFRRAVAEHGIGDAELDERIAFHPWILYIPSVLYAEHGQQYDSINSLATVIRPFLPDQAALIELPLGSFFVRYMFNYMEDIDPFADNVKPPTRYIGWVLRNHPVLALTSTYKYAQLFVRSLPKTSKLSTDEQHTRRDRYRREVLDLASREIGLPASTLAAIDELAAIPALSSKRRQLQALVLKPLLPVVSVAAAAFGLNRVVRHLPERARWWTRAAGALTALVWRERQLLRPAIDTSDYLLTAARSINALLKESGHQVPVYVFGHTHKAAQALLDDDDASQRYFNTGTWTPIVPEAFSLLSARELYTFVQMTHDSSTGETVSRLLLWNDASGRAEPLPLLSEGEPRPPSMVTAAREKVSEMLGI